MTRKPKVEETAELEPQVESKEETSVTPVSHKVCENCNDSGKECYVCHAGRKVE